MTESDTYFPRESWSILPEYMTGADMTAGLDHIDRLVGGELDILADRPELYHRPLSSLPQIAPESADFPLLREQWQAAAGTMCREPAWMCVAVEDDPDTYLFVRSHGSDSGREFYVQYIQVRGVVLPLVFLRGDTDEIVVSPPPPVPPALGEVTEILTRAVQNPPNQAVESLFRHVFRSVDAAGGIARDFFTSFPGALEKYFPAGGCTVSPRRLTTPAEGREHLSLLAEAYRTQNPCWKVVHRVWSFEAALMYAAQVPDDESSVLVAYDVVSRPDLRHPQFNPDGLALSYVRTEADRCYEEHLLPLPVTVGGDLIGWTEAGIRKSRHTRPDGTVHPIHQDGYHFTNGAVSRRMLRSFIAASDPTSPPDVPPFSGP